MDGVQCCDAIEIHAKAAQICQADNCFVDDMERFACREFIDKAIVSFCNKLRSCVATEVSIGGCFSLAHPVHIVNINNIQKSPTHIYGHYECESVIWHLQLITVRFCWSKVLLPA